MRKRPATLMGKSTEVINSTRLSKISRIETEEKNETSISEDDI